MCDYSSVSDTLTYVQLFAALGQGIGGFALLIGAIVALSTLFKYHRNTVHDKWYEVRSDLYGVFWKGEGNAQVRYWISSDEGYEEIRDILKERNKDRDSHRLDSDDYKILEQIDQFLSVLARFREFDTDHLAGTRGKLWTTFFGIWIDKIRGDKVDDGRGEEYETSRPELKEYIKEYWKASRLLDPVKERKTIWERLKIF